MVILPRDEPVEARVWAVMIVIVAPGRDQLSGMAQVGEQVLIQALVAKAAVEASGEAILHRLAGRDVVPRDGSFLLPLQNGVRCQLRAIVADHHAGRATRSGDIVEFPRHPLPG